MERQAEGSRREGEGEGEGEEERVVGGIWRWLQEEEEWGRMGVN